MAPSPCPVWFDLMWATQFCVWLKRAVVSSVTPSWSSVKVISILVYSLSEDCGVLSMRDAMTAF